MINFNALNDQEGVRDSVWDMHHKEYKRWCYLSRIWLMVMYIMEYFFTKGLSYLGKSLF